MFSTGYKQTQHTEGTGTEGRKGRREGGKKEGLSYEFIVCATERPRKNSTTRQQPAKHSRTGLN